MLRIGVCLDLAVLRNNVNRVVLLEMAYGTRRDHCIQKRSTATLCTGLSQNDSIRVRAHLQLPLETLNGSRRIGPVRDLRRVNSLVREAVSVNRNPDLHQDLLKGCFTGGPFHAWDRRQQCGCE